MTDYTPARSYGPHGGKFCFYEGNEVVDTLHGPEEAMGHIYLIARQMVEGVQFCAEDGDPIEVPTDPRECERLIHDLAKYCVSFRELH